MSDETAKSALGKVEALWKLLPKAFQLDRLERLAMKNSIVAMNYAELICKINWVLLTWDRDIKMKKSLETNIIDWIFGDTESFTFEAGDPIAKLSAIGYCFAHQGGKIEQAINTATFRNMSAGFDKLLDFVGSAVSAGQQTQRVQLKETGKSERAR